MGEKRAIINVQVDKMNVKASLIRPSDESFKEEEPRKLFIGGLSRNTTADSMKAYFSQFGAVNDVIIMMDPQGLSRGFGFVTFIEAQPIDRIMQESVHYIDAKQVDVKRSLAKHLRPPAKQLSMTKKVFLGGIPTDMTEADLKQTMSFYGKVSECNIMHDDKTMKSRGFGFVGFEDESVIDKLLKQQFIPIKNRQVEVKAARQRINVPVHSSMAGSGLPSSIPTINGAAAQQPSYDYGYGYGYQQQQAQAAAAYSNAFGAAYANYGYPAVDPAATYSPYGQAAAYPTAYASPYPTAQAVQPSPYGVPGAQVQQPGVVHSYYSAPTTDDPPMKRQKHGEVAQAGTNGEIKYDPALYAAAFGTSAAATYVPQQVPQAAGQYAAYHQYGDPNKTNGANAAPVAPAGYYSHYSG